MSLQVVVDFFLLVMILTILVHKVDDVGLQAKYCVIIVASIGCGPV